MSLSMVMYIFIWKLPLIIKFILMVLEKEGIMNEMKKIIVTNKKYSFQKNNFLLNINY